MMLPFIFLLVSARDYPQCTGKPAWALRFPGPTSGLVTLAGPGPGMMPAELFKFVSDDPGTNGLSLSHKPAAALASHLQSSRRLWPARHTARPFRGQSISSSSSSLPVLTVVCSSHESTQPEDSAQLVIPFIMTGPLLSIIPRFQAAG
jgi:hypothetical protein